MSKTYLTKADLLSGITLSPVDFEVDGLGWVQVRGLGLAALDEINSQFTGHDLLVALHAAHKGLVNPQLSIEDLSALGEGNPEMVSNISKRVFELSGKAAKKDIDPLAGSSS